jgi:hypothetical protein
MSYSSLSLWSSVSESYALSPMSLAGSSSRKLPAKTSSTSCDSCGEALWTDTASGRLLSAAIARIFVPLPRRVGPTASPPFSPLQTWHRQRLLPTSACLSSKDALPTAALSAPTFPSAPTAENGGGRSDREDISPVAHATARPCPKPTALHLTQLGCPAMDDLAHRPVASVGGSVRSVPIGYR